MSNIAGNQEGTEFLVGQVAQAVGDYLALLERDEEATEEYKEAIAIYDQVLPYSSDFLTAQKNKERVGRKLNKLLERIQPSDGVPSRIIVNLSQWLQNNFTEALEAGWQAFEELLSTQQAELVPIPIRTKTQPQFQGRVKRINLGLEHQVIALVVAISREAAGEARISAQVYPIKGQKYLPSNLSLALLSESGETLLEVQARSQDNYIKLKRFRQKDGGYFSIKVALGDICLTEDFVV